MIGQSRLKSLINSFDFDSFPNVVLLVGEEGSGKRTLVKEVIQPTLCLDTKDITSEITYEGIGSIYLTPIPFIYIIDMDNLSEKKYNVLLKFLEEPPLNCKIVLLSSNSSRIIPTILNRCQVWNLDKYTDEELLNFTSDKSLIDYIRFPGKLLNCGNIQNIVDLSRNILLKCKLVTLNSLLAVSSKIKWNKSDENKIDPSIFCDIFIHEAANLFKNKKISVILFNIVNRFVNSSVSQSSFENCLVELKFNEY